MLIQTIYSAIKKTKIIPKLTQELKILISNIMNEQKASLFCLSILYGKTDNYFMYDYLLEKYNFLKKYKDFLDVNNKENISKNDKISFIIINKTFNNEEFTEKEIYDFVYNFTNKAISLIDVSFWSMLVCEIGLSDKNTYLLTKSMTNTGNIYNYKSSFPNYFFTRRYPTGGVSEKLSLLLPTFIMCISEKYNIKSPFTIGRSLGFTGGTWDKLSSIPDFNFAEPGIESIKRLDKCGISMTVSKDDMCPADRILYQLRSLVGTIESTELATASIVSKQLATPCDYLVLDTRYGDGAFFEKNEAIKMSNLIKKFLEYDGIKVDIVYTDTPFPNGSSIGNALEVEEAIYILTGHSKICWHPDGLKEQKKLLSKFLSLIMQKITNDGNFDANNIIEDFIANGTARNNFIKLLENHGVSKKTIENIFKNSFIETIGLKKVFDIITDKRILFKGINQRLIGDFVNFKLGNARYEFGIKEKSLNNILLYQRPGDIINAGDKIFSVYSTKPATILKNKKEITNSLLDCVYFVSL